MTRSNHAVLGRVPACSLAASLLAAMLGALSRADDVPADPEQAARPSRFNQAADLGGMFDSMAFGLPLSVTDRTPVRPDAAQQLITERLAPLAGRADARIAAVDRIVGLSDPQRQKLRTAAESDMRRLVDAVVEARGKYAGRVATQDPRGGGWDEPSRKLLGELSQDAQRVRRLQQEAFGGQSLVAKVVAGALDEEQARKYDTVMRGKAACRWRAIVAAGLADCDEQMGFTQKQHDAVMAAVLAEPPDTDLDASFSWGPLSDAPAAVVVAGRLMALGEEKLAALLDPRQCRLVALLAERDQRRPGS